MERQKERQFHNRHQHATFFFISVSELSEFFFEIFDLFNSLGRLFDLIPLNLRFNKTPKNKLLSGSFPSSSLGYIKNITVAVIAPGPGDASLNLSGCDEDLL